MKKKYFLSRDEQAIMCHIGLIVFFFSYKYKRLACYLFPDLNCFDASLAL